MDSYHRKFNGKTYKLDSRKENKLVAKGTARSLRHEGYNARIVKLNMGHSIMWGVFKNKKRGR